ncbi:MAG: twin-arginine translocation signal domain-containing protein, partial [Planctomycetota bacterium]
MSLSRRRFLQSTAVGAAALGLGARQESAPNLEHTITTISGKPRERGRQYGAQFK